MDQLGSTSAIDDLFMKSNDSSGFVITEGNACPGMEFIKFGGIRLLKKAATALCGEETFQETYVPFSERTS